MMNVELNNYLNNSFSMLEELNSYLKTYYRGTKTEDEYIFLESYSSSEMIEIPILYKGKLLEPFATFYNQILILSSTNTIYHLDDFFMMLDIHLFPIPSDWLTEEMGKHQIYTIGELIPMIFNASGANRTHLINYILIYKALTFCMITNWNQIQPDYKRKERIKN